jgi:hypothetical protein
VLFTVQLSNLSEVSVLLDPTLMGIIASAVAFFLVFLARQTRIQ